MNRRLVGERVRALRLIAGLGQVELASRAEIATGSVSKIENGRVDVSTDLLDRISKVLDCRPSYLTSQHDLPQTTRPWLRAYADASQRALDRQLAECTAAIDAIEVLSLTTIPDTLPVFDGDLFDDDAIERFASDVRVAAQLGEGDVVGNCIRAAERLGCVVLPMREELGRHVGLSLRVNLVPVISVSRPSLHSDHRVPGDRQRMTVAHELGHLALHSVLGPPSSAAESTQIEKQAFRFAGAFLAPGDAMLEELHEHGGRVTLKTLAIIKERWGVSIKALVMRFRSLGVIDENQARNLYKQISARGYSKVEPVEVGTEDAIWFRKALVKKMAATPDPFWHAAELTGLGRSHLDRWTDWSPTGPVGGPGEVVQFPAGPRRSRSRSSVETADSAVIPLRSK